MLDPFPLAPPESLVRLIKPSADALDLQTLPLHFHEVLFAAFLYWTTCYIISPLISSRLAPGTYPRLSRRSKLNWDVHVVSFVQAIIINSLSLYIIWFDEERKSWRPRGEWRERLFGYYGSGGLCQSFALGYFLWDLTMCSMHVDIFGWGMLAHAVSAVAVFALGYRPIIYFSAPVFLLYELSSPFLNIHWFCDKLNLTGSIYQAINGAFLVATFFGCRIVWGIYNSVLVFRDMLWMVQAGHTVWPSGGVVSRLSVSELLAVSKDNVGQQNAFNPEQYIPLWIPLIYLASNLTLNSLNLFWFYKMIETIRTRFAPPFGTKGVGPEKIFYRPPESDDEDSDLGIGEPGKRRRSTAEKKQDESAATEGQGSVKAARQRAERELQRPVGTVTDTKVERSLYEDGHTSVEVSGTQRRRRKA